MDATFVFIRILGYGGTIRAHLGLWSQIRDLVDVENTAWPWMEPVGFLIGAQFRPTAIGTTLHWSYRMKHKNFGRIIQCSQSPIMITMGEFLTDGPYLTTLQIP